MLTRRIIATILIKDGMLVKGKQFINDRVIGHPLQAIRVMQARGIDEMVILDVGATKNGRGPDFDFMRTLCDDAFMPLAIGGGIKSVADARELLRIGADKVVVGKMAEERPKLITELAESFGSNAVVVTVNCRKNELFYESCPYACQTLEELGAGEIILQSMDRDGMMTGYDLDLLKIVANEVNCPVVASSGCGCYEDMASAFQVGVDAVAAGALWSFTENTPREAKKYLKSRGIHVRL